MKFTLINDDMGEHLLMELEGVISIVPMDESNPDYQAYLAYLAEQETA